MLPILQSFENASEPLRFYLSYTLKRWKTEAFVNENRDTWKRF